MRKYPFPIEDNIISADALVALGALFVLGRFRRLAGGYGFSRDNSYRMSDALVRDLDLFGYVHADGEGVAISEAGLELIRMTVIEESDTRQGISPDIFRDAGEPVRCEFVNASVVPELELTKL